MTSRWPPPRSVAKAAAVVVAAVLGTGGCGAVLAGAAQMMAASTATVTKRLDAIEAKLDTWRAEQAQAEAKATAAARDLYEVRSRLRVAESRLDACERAK